MQSQSYESTLDARDAWRGGGVGGHECDVFGHARGKALMRTGSHLHAKFRGQRERELTWFGASSTSARYCLAEARFVEKAVAPGHLATWLCLPWHSAELGFGSKRVVASALRAGLTPVGAAARRLL